LKISGAQPDPFGQTFLSHSTLSPKSSHIQTELLTMDTWLWFDGWHGQDVCPKRMEWTRGRASCYAGDNSQPNLSDPRVVDYTLEEINHIKPSQEPKP